MKVSAFLKLACRLGVITLAFWVAGAGCLLGCEGMASAAPDAGSSNSDQPSIIVAEGDACAATEGHSCCAKKTRSATPARGTARRNLNPTSNGLNLTESRLAESSTSGMKACPFAISRAVTVAKSHDGQMSSTAGVSAVLEATPVGEQKLSLSTLSQMPNRGHTYLRCCTFLI